MEQQNSSTVSKPYSTVTYGVPPFFASKYAREASKNWDKFYIRNGTKFFRDRHWVSRESHDGFSVLSKGASVVIEAGCGAANLAFPLLDTNPELRLYLFDFAPSALDLVRSSERFDASRIHLFQWDFARTPFESLSQAERGGLESNTADYALLVFVLSAVPPDLQVTALCALYNLLRPGGRILFRDYASGDMAESRFAATRKIAERYFVRQDGTLSYFFDEQTLERLMYEAGFEKVNLRRVQRTLTNRKEEVEMNRIFLQAEFMRPEAD